MIEYISEIIVQFVKFVRSRLDEEGTPAVIVMDNFKAQKTPQVNKLLKKTACMCTYFPLTLPINSSQ